MSQIMEMDLRTADLLSSRTPCGLKHVRAKRSTLFSRENESIRIQIDIAIKMSGDSGNYVWRDHHAALTGGRLRRTEQDPSVGEVLRCLFDNHDAVKEVDVAPSQSEHLTSSQLTPRGKNDDRRHAVGHAGNKHLDLGDGRERPLGRVLDACSFHPTR